MKISQSLLKSIIDYNEKKMCGLVFEAKYIKNRYDLFPPSEAQNLGAWFEYMATGSIPKNGTVPQAEYMKRGKDEKGNPSLTADYRLMSKHIENFRTMMSHYGFEIIRVGEDIKALYPDSVEKWGFEVWLTGTLDVRARATKDVWANYENSTVMVAKKGQEVIIDLKVSGLLDDKWNPFGWDINSLQDKVKLVTQPVQYKYIELLNTGEELPFLFMLFAPKNEFDARIIDFKVDVSAYNTHMAFIEAGVKSMLSYKKNGFIPRPSLAECSECPLRTDCKYKAITAPITVFYFGNQ